MSKLDKVDLKLLGELENNARQTLSQIAKKLGTSQQVVSYRINSLLKRNVLYGFHTVVNFAMLGYTSYRTMIRFSNISDQKYKEIINYLLKHPNVLWLVGCGGRWDLLVNFTAKNVVQYNEFLRELKNKFPDQIQNHDILITIGGTFFGRDYLNKKIREIKPVIYFGHEFKPAKVDNTDLKILELISENARMSSVEIANKLGISPNTVILRIKNMKKTGLIQGFKPSIQVGNTKWAAYKALIKFQNITEKKELEIMNYLQTNVNVIAILRLIGPWDFEIEFEVETKEDLLKLTRDVRDKFKEVIQGFEILPLYREYKYNYFPRDTLKEYKAAE
ncbi:winged helix-turn-helix transcriptional regulator [Candidatus Woesearchaeota archaeon]|nr:winged helix-turn-helix transcriptional regulator [Candidatus Woesearchaeota archaeon]